MAKHILICRDCDVFSMEDKCSKCGGPTGPVQPPKFSPDDKYAELKRGIKEEEYKKRGLL